MINILIITLVIVLSNIFLSKNYFKFKIRKTFNLYLNSLQSIQFNSSSTNYNLQDQLNLVSKYGFVLLIKVFILMIPYLILFSFLRTIGFNYFIALIVPIFSYLGIFKK